MRFSLSDKVRSGSHYCQSNHVCQVSEMLGKQTATSLNPGWYLVRSRSGESWLVGFFGAPWAATGSLLHQFESCWTSAERKQDCWTANTQTTNKQHLQSDSPVLIRHFLSKLKLFSRRLTELQGDYMQTVISVKFMVWMTDSLKLL